MWLPFLLMINFCCCSCCYKSCSSVTFLQKIKWKQKWNNELEAKYFKRQILERNTMCVSIRLFRFKRLIKFMYQIFHWRRDKMPARTFIFLFLSLEIINLLAENICWNTTRNDFFRNAPNTTLISFRYSFQTFMPLQGLAKDVTAT
jgi:hypothetical protein